MQSWVLASGSVSKDSSSVSVDSIQGRLQTVHRDTVIDSIQKIDVRCLNQLKVCDIDPGW